MICAIYCRKSTEQSGVADEQKSVVRQLEHARAYATRKGWTVADDYVYVDDGISGAEFANRPGFLRLMNALKPRPPFQVLVISDLDRLGRESIETTYAIKQLNVAGVRVFAYLEDKELRLDSPIEALLTQARRTVPHSSARRPGSARTTPCRGRPGRGTSPAAACSAMTMWTSGPAANGRTWSGESTRLRPPSPADLRAVD
jgi:Resolvase, N terminal domain